ncbi:MAG: hypothetical protein EXR72_06360 [Myxococcales bacterium]|nr:hypothetical protein [Myxococcales bacterium]
MLVTTLRRQVPQRRLHGECSGIVVRPVGSSNPKAGGALTVVSLSTNWLRLVEAGRTGRLGAWSERCTGAGAGMLDWPRETPGKLAARSRVLLAILRPAARVATPCPGPRAALASPTILEVPGPGPANRQLIRPRPLSLQPGTAPGETAPDDLPSFC